MGDLYRSIAGSDGGIVGLVDNLAQARNFSDWSLKFVRPAAARTGSPPLDPSPPHGRSPPGERFSPPREAPGPEALAARNLAAEALKTQLERQLLRHLRVAPRQSRAQQTVERLLDGAAGALRTVPTVARVSLEAVALEAAVTQQSAYRYFANIDELIRASVRRMQAEWYLRLLDDVMRLPLRDEATLAEAVVGFVAGENGSELAVAPRMRLEILRHHHEIGYEAAFAVADAICAMPRPGEVQRRPCGAPEVAAGLTALLALAKSLALTDAAALDRPAVRQMMIDVFLAALGGPLRAGVAQLSRRV